MNRAKPWLPTAACLCFFLATTATAAAEDRDTFFEQRIRPILVQHCDECHSGLHAEGGLLLDSRAGWEKGGDRGPAIVPGKPDQSLLIHAVRYQDDGLAMPPKEAGGKLSEEAIKQLEKWVRDGAFDPRNSNAKLGGMPAAEAASWWAFQSLPAPDTDPSPARIDRYLESQWQDRSLVPVAQADKRTLLRRATYDLTGLPPTADEVDAFLADESPDALVNVIDRLLASDQYGVRWGRHWLDVVRYADTAGENTDRPLPHAWRYRNWVFDWLNRDEPFDEFVRLQLAGDLIRRGQSLDRQNEGIIATGYLAIARRFGHDIDKQTYLMNEDVIDNLGKNFLGLTIGCARCHDHKYDPITTEDYYALYGVFESTRFAFPGCEPKGQPRDLIPLLSQQDIDALIQPWSEKVAQAQAIQERLDRSGKALKEIQNQSAHRLINTTMVGEGATVPLANLRVSVRQGEVLQLTVFPNESHGADTTRIAWKITEDGGAGRVWNVQDLIESITTGNPRIEDDGAAWCFCETTDGHAFLNRPHDPLPEHTALKAWKRADDAISVFVNSLDQAVSVWTILPARAFFVHPEHQRPVSVAWVSPLDGFVEISGAVTDAHPSGGDGVSFELTHIPSSRFGKLLLETGHASSMPPVDPGPKPEIPLAYAVTDAQPVDSRIHKRGDPEQLGDPVPRRWLAVLGGEPFAHEQESGRRALADQIATHPLTARVMVNRIWQWHFGRGLVATPNNFGSRGQAPSHPELLDWLASQFVAGGYRVKPMHRLIMLSEAYRRSSERPAAWLDADPDNQLFGRLMRRRLSAEEIRDSLLMASGQLDLSPAEAHPFPHESTWTFTQHQPFNAVYETNKRSAFLMVQRQHRHPFLALFDGADPNASTARRETSTVPTQTLYFLNDPFFHEQAAGFANRLLRHKDSDERLRHAYRILFQREPSAQEKETGQSFLRHYPAEESESWRAYARVLMAGNEFIHVD